jgi:hypothetical protein
VSRNATTRAALPPVEFEIPDRLAEDGLVVLAANSDGTETFRYDLRRLPGAEQLRRELAAVISGLSNEGGRWRSMQTVRSSTATVSYFLRWLERTDRQLVSLSEFSRGMWDEWLLHCAPTKSAGGSVRVITMRVVLRAFPRLPQDSRRAMMRRTGIPTSALPTPSYSPDELSRITEAARGAVRAAESRIKANARLLLRFRHEPAGLTPAEYERGAASDALLHGDELTAAQFKALGAWKHGRPAPREARRALFLDSFEAWACTVLLTAENGWNASVIKRMKTPSDHAGAGEDDLAIYTVDLDKPRRGRRRHMTNNLVDSGANSQGHTLGMVLSATAPARWALTEQGFPADGLILFLKDSLDGRGPGAFGVGFPQQGVAVHSPWLQGVPHVSLQRLRRTVQAGVEAGPSQNTQRVHEDVYVLRDERVRRGALPVIEDGISDALATLETTFQLRLVSSDQADGDINSGRADTPVSACRDVHHHPVTGALCQESFLACLNCLNAVATPRHLPRLVYLYVALASLEQVVSAPEWASSWSVHHQRLGMLLTAHTTEPERQAALAAVTEAEKANVERLLAGRLDS